MYQHMCYLDAKQDRGGGGAECMNGGGGTFWSSERQTFEVDFPSQFPWYTMEKSLISVHRSAVKLTKPPAMCTLHLNLQSVTLIQGIDSFNAEYVLSIFRTPFDDQYSLWNVSMGMKRVQQTWQLRYHQSVRITWQVSYELTKRLSRNLK